MLSLVFGTNSMLIWSLIATMVHQNGNPLTINDMSFQYYVQGDSLEIQLSAPTQGWVAVGFHSEPELIGSDLLMFSVQEGKTIYQDQYIRNWNDHPEDTSLGGQNNIQLIGNLEDDWSTTVKFKIPINSGDSYDKVHQVDRDFYLLLAYSAEDDFAHHSIIRKQIAYRFSR